ncbi:MAG: hypothetical protein NVS1B6_14930 [Steroidobacteraceae bacterium]
MSLSDGRPVAALDASYDFANGLYLSLAGHLVATKSEGVRFLGVAAGGGYAVRLGPIMNADFGIVHSRYTHYSGSHGRLRYTEVYAGISGKFIGTRLSISPDYLGSARWTAHAGVDGHIDLSRLTVINGEIGLLTGLGGTYARAGRSELDAQLGVNQRIGPVVFHAALSARSRHYRYKGPANRHAALVIGISTAL